MGLKLICTSASKVKAPLAPAKVKGTGVPTFAEPAGKRTALGVASVPKLMEFEKVLAALALPAAALPVG